jgi:hypothetical protein
VEGCENGFHRIIRDSACCSRSGRWRWSVRELPSRTAFNWSDNRMVHGPLANPPLPPPTPSQLQIHLLSCFERCLQLEAGLLHTFYTSVVNSICLKRTSKPYIDQSCIPHSTHNCEWTIARFRGARPACYLYRARSDRALVSR